MTGGAPGHRPRGRLDYELRRLEREEGWERETVPLLPFAPVIVALDDARLRMESLDAAKAATALATLAAQVDAARKAQETATARPDRTIAFRAQEDLAGLKKTLESWYQFYAGYDPFFTWWAAAPYKKASQALDDYRASLREKVLAIKKGADDPIVGTPIGRPALVADLLSEFAALPPGQHEPARGHRLPGGPGGPRAGQRHRRGAPLVQRQLPSLYQLAYMMGGPQFRALHRELVESGRTGDREFHDTIITGGPMPVEMVRARLVRQALPRDYRASWKYLAPAP